MEGNKFIKTDNYEIYNYSEHCGNRADKDRAKKNIDDPILFFSIINHKDPSVCNKITHFK